MHAIRLFNVDINVINVSQRNIIRVILIGDQTSMRGDASFTSPLCEITYTETFMSSVAVSTLKVDILVIGLIAMHKA